MKRVLFTVSAVIFLYCFSGAQTVQGTIISPSANKIAVYAKIGSPGLTNVLFLGINVTVSIPDQSGSGGNPTGAQVMAISKIPNLNITEALTSGYPANPYVPGDGRAYYSYIMNDNAGTTGTTWPANSANNPVAEFTFPSDSYISGAHLDDLSSGGGPNQQMYWYVSIIGGASDITDYTTMFYGVPAIPPTNNGGASPSFVSLQPISVLPVRFLGFSATKNGNSALLSWSVESEDNNTSTYEVQRSLSGVDFAKVATMPALNNGLSSNSYSFTQDNLSAIRSSGVIYFRIKQVDRDGKFVYTPVRSVRLDSKGLVVGVYPNPIKSSANVSFDLADATDVSIKVIDASGKQVAISQVQGFKGANLSKINMAKFAAGSYTLSVQAGNEVKTITIVKADQ